MEADEAEELAVRSAQMPTSLNEFKKHPLYILGRDVKSTQAIHPPSTKPVGICKGQRVYHRSHVYDLRSEQAWFRRGFALQPGVEPARLKESTPSAKASARASAAAAEGEAPLDAAGGSSSGSHALNGGGGGGAATTTTLLFGEWQTAPYVPPVAVDGIVPRGSHGHVELWTPNHLPGGTVVLKEPHAAQAAKALGIDAAPAMVGFDVHDGRPVPKFDGIVVCLEHVALLREAASAMQDQADDTAAHKRHNEALDLWRNLLRALAVRRRLEKQYGSG